MLNLLKGDNVRADIFKSILDINLASSFQLISYNLSYLFDHNLNLNPSFTTFLNKNDYFLNSREYFFKKKNKSNFLECIISYQIFLLKKHNYVEFDFDLSKIPDINNNYRSIIKKYRFYESINDIITNLNQFLHQCFSKYKSILKLSSKNNNLSYLRDDFFILLFKSKIKNYNDHIYNYIYEDNNFSKEKLMYIYDYLYSFYLLQSFKFYISYKNNSELIYSEYLNTNYKLSKINDLYSNLELNSFCIFNYTNSHTTHYYINSIIKICRSLNISIYIIDFSSTFVESEHSKSIISFSNVYVIRILQQDDDFYKTVIDKVFKSNFIKSILIATPIPEYFTNISKYCRKYIPFSKDIESVSCFKKGNFLDNPIDKSNYPCTVSAVIKLMEFYKINVKSKNICIIGNGDIIGKPLSIVLSAMGSTVVLCHKYTVDISFHTLKSDIIIIAVGKVNLLTKDMVKSSHIVIDVGTNYIDNKIVGDADYNNICNIVSGITPVPNGIAKITNYILIKKYIENIINIY